MTPNETSHFTSNFGQRVNEVRDSLNRATHIFFPPNRFEEPAWLNELNLRNKTSYASLKSYSNLSNRPVVNYAPMRDLQSWLLDLVYDSYAIERKSELYMAPHIGGLGVPQIVDLRNGPASTILESIAIFLTTLFRKQGTVTWSVGARNRRQIGISVNNELLTSNLFQLSTGQAVLLDLFLAIIRDFDLSVSPLTQLSDIEGLVVVDEIDLHLHTDLQHDLLPNLIRLFPKVQFILTTHSPLFLIGMEKTFTSDGFQLIELPTGQQIEVERFSEFEAAYKYMQDSARFQEDIRNKIEDSQKPVLYLEGTTDIDYLTKAGELLGKTDIV
ncbi:MAG: AAA family ATPase, partial [Spirochaetales bacterium]|nr:AAA family ATPase [Spirochaetales bacterium]